MKIIKNLSILSLFLFLFSCNDSSKNSNSEKEELKQIDEHLMTISENKPFGTTETRAINRNSDTQCQNLSEINLSESEGDTKLSFKIKYFDKDNNPITDCEIQQKKDEFVMIKTSISLENSKQNISFYFNSNTKALQNDSSYVFDIYMENTFKIEKFNFKYKSNIYFSKVYNLINEKIEILESTISLDGGNTYYFKINELTNEKTIPLYNSNDQKIAYLKVTNTDFNSGINAIDFRVLDLDGNLMN